MCLSGGSCPIVCSNQFHGKLGCQPVRPCTQFNILFFLSQNCRALSALCISGLRACCGSCVLRRRNPVRGAFQAECLPACGAATSCPHWQQLTFLLPHSPLLLASCRACYLRRDPPFLPSSLPPTCSPADVLCTRRCGPGLLFTCCLVLSPPSPARLSHQGVGLWTGDRATLHFIREHLPTGGPQGVLTVAHPWPETSAVAEATRRPPAGGPQREAGRLIPWPAAGHPRGVPVEAGRPTPTPRSLGRVSPHHPSRVALGGGRRVVPVLVPVLMAAIVASRGVVVVGWAALGHPRAV